MMHFTCNVLFPTLLFQMRFENTKSLVFQQTENINRSMYLMLCNQCYVSIEQSENIDSDKLIRLYIFALNVHIIGNCENDDRTNKHYSYF